MLSKWPTKTLKEVPFTKHIFWGIVLLNLQDLYLKIHVKHVSLVNHRFHMPQATPMGGCILRIALGGSLRESWGGCNTRYSPLLMFLYRQHCMWKFVFRWPACSPHHSLNNLLTLLETKAAARKPSSQSAPSRFPARGKNRSPPSSKTKEKETIS